MPTPTPQDAQSILGYLFQDEALLREALTHASLADHRLKSNERMEFLGDAILGSVVCEELYLSYPDLLEGDLTKIKSTVVSRRTCAQITRAIKLDELLSLGKGMNNRPQLPESVAAAVFESIIAAIYLDGGVDVARGFILKHLNPLIEEAANSAHQQNFKSALQQLSQRYFPSHNAVYVLLDTKGPDHAKAFEVCIEINNRRFESAWANNKKQAEQDAALNALCCLGLASVDSDGVVLLTAKPEAATVTSRLEALPTRKEAE